MLTVATRSWDITGLKLLFLLFEINLNDYLLKCFNNQGCWIHEFRSDLSPLMMVLGKK